MRSELNEIHKVSAATQDLTNRIVDEIFSNHRLLQFERNYSFDCVFFIISTFRLLLVQNVVGMGGTRVIHLIFGMKACPWCGDLTHTAFELYSWMTNLAKTFVSCKKSVLGDLREQNAAVALNWTFLNLNTI